MSVLDLLVLFPAPINGEPVSGVKSSVVVGSTNTGALVVELASNEVAPCHVASESDVLYSHEYEVPE